MSQIQTKFLENSAVTEAKIANDAVTNDKIADNAVDSLQIAANAVIEAKIANDAVTENKIAANAVTSAKIATGAVTNDELNASAITGQTAETSPDNADLLLIYDDSATALKKMTRSNFLSGFTVAQVYKEAVEVVSLSNLDLSGEETIDGVLTSTSRVLVAGQTAPEENGIYVSAAGAWSRASDMDVDSEVFKGMQVYVAEGTSHAHSKWVLVSSGPFTLGTTGLQFYKLDQWNKEDLTLDGTDITNQYKDLAFEVIPSSLDLFIDGVMQDEGSDYTLSVSGGVTRVTFAGDLATGGDAALVATDVLRVKYQIKR